MMSERVPKVLLVDDNQAIHEDYRKILYPQNSRAELAELEAELFETPVAKTVASLELTSVFQGQDAIREVELAKKAGAPFSVAFVDIRMPPGIDGVETTAKLWEIDPDLQVILCSAHSDYSFVDVLQRLGATDRLLILKKPFENIEVLQAALALTQKWKLLQASRLKVEELDAAIEARTRALKESDRQLFEARKLEAVGRLAGGMAHEVNNPLSATVSALEFIKEELTAAKPVDPTLTDLPTLRELPTLSDLIEACEEALQGTRRIVSIIEAVRSFAQAQAGVSEPLSLSTLAKDVLGPMRADLPKGVRLELDLQLTPQILAPLSGMKLALLNLVSNALLARPRTSDPYTIYVSTALDAGSWPYLEVRDEGVGIAPENLPRLFDPFFTTRDVGQGAGLGLCAAQGLVARLGGTVKIESELGKGTRARMRLPPISDEAGHPGPRGTRREE